MRSSTTSSNGSQTPSARTPSKTSSTRSAPSPRYSHAVEASHPGRFSSGGDGLSAGAWERFRELAARADPQLGEHLSEVVGHGVLAEKEPGADLDVRHAVS